MRMMVMMIQTRWTTTMMMMTNYPYVVMIMGAKD